jgi:hypothetical protein
VDLGALVKLAAALVARWFRRRGERYGRHARQRRRHRRMIEEDRTDDDEQR